MSNNNKHITLDVETYMPPATESAEVLAVPRLVCMSWTDGKRHGLVGRAEAVRLFTKWLANPEMRLSGHNVPFDLLVCLRATWEETGRDLTPQVLEMVRAGRVSDTATRAALLAIAGGGIPKQGLGLATLVKAGLGVDMGDDKKIPWSWRHRYAELEGVPVEQYPARAASYAVDDTLLTRRLWERQAELAAEADLRADDGLVQNERFQVAAALWAAMLSARGINIDYEWACTMADEYTAREEEAARVLSADMLPDGTPVQPLLRPDGTMDSAVKRALFQEAFDSIGEEPKTTPTGLVCTDQAAMDRLIEADADGPRFGALSLYNQAQKFKSAYLAPILDAGGLGLPLHHRLNPLVDSGRTSARGPNTQNFPARAKAKEAGRAITGPMIRGCFVPRAGHVFVAADYAAIELAGLAQVICNITGEIDELGQAINAGLDVHVVVAAKLMGVTYEALSEVLAWGKAWEKAGCPEPAEDAEPHERAKHAGQVLFYKDGKKNRQFAKVLNYGAPGGCSANTLRVQGKQQGVELTDYAARKAVRAWHTAYPKMRTYFNFVSSCEDPTLGMFVCEQHGPGGSTSGWRRRLTNRYTSACNTFFQGLVADGAKAAGWLLAKACYADPTSPLYGCAMVLFVHDEFVLEVPAERADAAKEELCRLMVAGMAKFIPDIRVDVEPTVYEDRWSK